MKKLRKKYWFHERILNKLNEIDYNKLSLFDAPSGYGKTVAIHKFLSTVDESSEVFIRVIEEDIEYNDAEVMKDILQMVGCNTNELKEIHKNFSAQYFEELFHDYDINHKIYIVIENLHNLQQFIPKRYIELLIRYLPDNVHLILTTRNSSVNMVTFMEAIEVNYVSIDDLIFYTEDILNYYRSEELYITKKQASIIEEETNGWVIAVYLHFMQYQKTGNIQPSNKVFLLVKELIWNHFSEDDKDVLFQLFNLQHFGMEEVRFILNVDAIDESIIELFQSIPFILYNVTTNSYKIHKLLYNFIQAEFSLTSIQYQKTIKLQCAKWYEYKGNVYEALKYYYDLKDYDAIFRMYLTLQDVNYDSTLKYKELFSNIFDNLAEDAIPRYPESLFSAGFMSMVYNKRDILTRIMNILLHNSQVNKDEDVRKRSLGYYYMLLTYFDFNDFEKMSKYYVKAYEVLKTSIHSVVLQEPWNYGCSSILFLYYRDDIEGDIDKVRNGLNSYLSITGFYGPSVNDTLYAEQYLLQGDLKQAEIYALRALHKTQAHKQNALTICASVVYAQVQILNGRKEEYLQTWKNLEVYMNEYRQASITSVCSLGMGYLTQFTSEIDDIPAWILDEQEHERVSEMSCAYLDIIYGNYLIMSEKYAKYISLINYFMERATRHPQGLGVIYTAIYGCIAYHQLQDNEEAEKYALQFMEYVYKDNVILPVAIHYEVLKPVLLEIDVKQEILDEIETLHQRWAWGKQKIKENEIPLSQRELEVAKLVSQGLTNKEIASDLFVSISTVKSVLSKIFSKTGISSRSMLGSYLEKMEVK